MVRGGSGDRSSSGGSRAEQGDDTESSQPTNSGPPQQPHSFSPGTSSSVAECSPNGAASVRRRGPGKGPTQPRPDDRPYAPMGKKGFVQATCRSCIGTTVRTHLTGPWLRWSDWPGWAKDNCFDIFKKHYKFHDDAEERKGREFWEKFIGTNYPKWLHRARERAAKKDPQFLLRPNPTSSEYWISDPIWKQFCKVWATTEWQAIAGIAAANRGKTENHILYAGGSIPVEELYMRMAQEKGHKLCHLDVWTKAHTKKRGSWSTSRAQSLAETYKSRLEAKSQEIASYTQSPAPPLHEIDPDHRIWTNVVGGVKKGRLIGVGKASGPSSSSSGSSQREEALQNELEMLKKQMQEMHHQMQQQAEQTANLMKLMYQRGMMGQPHPEHRDTTADDKDDNNDEFAGERAHDEEGDK